MAKKFYSSDEVNNSIIAKHKNIIPVALTKKVKEGIVQVDNAQVVKSNGMNTSFTIFHLQETANRFGLEYDTILVVIYLQELVYFSWKIKIADRTLILRPHIDLGLVEKHDSGRLYKLTKFGNQVANFFNQTSNNKYLEDNRETEVDSDSSVKDVLSGFFD